MNILVVGSGGREHALVWKLKSSPLVKQLYCAPGNGGIAKEAVCLPLGVNDSDRIILAAKENKIDLVVIGPEQPLVDGLADMCESVGIPVFGPVKAAARLEGSKIFAKEFMVKHNIPTAPFRVFGDTSEESVSEAKTYLRENQKARVIKADGLCAGKGVLVCQSLEEAESAVDTIAVKKEFGDAGNKFIIEELLSGQELSILVLTDGKSLVPLLPSQDHKQIFAGDKGPNTGGMGAYTPVPFVDNEMYNRFVDTICKPIITGLQKEDIEYKGVIYAGIMLVDDVPYVLEFNCRFGDPETQPILHILQSDLAELLNKCAHRELGDTALNWDSGYSVCVTMASGGYPGAYEKDKQIFGIEEAESLSNVKVFHAGTTFKEDTLVTSGGRVLGVTAKGSSLQDSVDQAYAAVKRIHFDNHYFRPDIGFRVL